MHCKEVVDTLLDEPVRERNALFLTSQDKGINSRILRLPDVLHKVGLSKSSVYQMMDNNRFPRNFRIGAKAVGWDSSDIDLWVSQQKGGL